MPHVSLSFPLVMFWLLLAMVLVDQAIWLLLPVTHCMLFCLHNSSKKKKIINVDF
jgi:hypothetical protein